MHPIIISSLKYEKEILADQKKTSRTHYSPRRSKKNVSTKLELKHHQDKIRDLGKKLRTEQDGRADDRKKL